MKQDFLNEVVSNHTKFNVTRLQINLINII